MGTHLKRACVVMNAASFAKYYPMGHNTIDTFKEKADSHHPTGKIVNDQNIGL